MPGYSGYYFPMIESPLVWHKLPYELKYLAVLESGLDPIAVLPQELLDFGSFYFTLPVCFIWRLHLLLMNDTTPLNQTKLPVGIWYICKTCSMIGISPLRPIMVSLWLLKCNSQIGRKHKFREIREYLPDQTFSTVWLNVNKIR